MSSRDSSQSSDLSRHPVWEWLREPAWHLADKKKAPKRPFPVSKKPAGGSAIPSTVLKVAGAAATGITATGFIVVVGAAVFWIRFNELHLPATQAVSVMPKPELLVQGGQLSIIFLAISLIAVLLVFFTDQKGEILGSTLLVLGGLAVGAAFYVHSTELSAGTEIVLMILVGVLLLGCAAVGHRTGTSFWPLALAIFVVALAYSATVGILVVKQQKYAQGIAMLRGADDTGITGVYVTATKEKIYFGQAAEFGSGRERSRKLGLFEADLNAETTYAVGPLESQQDAAARARVMLNLLIADREGNRPPPPPPPASKDSKESAKEKPSSGESADSGKSAAQKNEPVDEVNLPVETVAKAFGGKITVRDEVIQKPLCLVRYTDASSSVLGPFWTSCARAKKLTTIKQVREVLALPGRFHPVFDMKVRAKVPAGTKLVLLKGEVGPQCEHAEAKLSCGHEYPGGGWQFYLPKPANAKFKEKQCTASAEDETTKWEECKPVG